MIYHDKWASLQAIYVLSYILSTSQNDDGNIDFGICTRLNTWSEQHRPDSKHHGQDWHEQAVQPWCVLSLPCNHSDTFELHHHNLMRIKKEYVCINCVVSKAYFKGPSTKTFLLIIDKPEKTFYNAINVVKTWSIEKTFNVR